VREIFILAFTSVQKPQKSTDIKPLPVPMPVVIYFPCNKEDMASPFESLLGNLNNLGFFQFLLPFLLTMAICYGILRYALHRILDKSAAALLSIVIAFFVMNYSGQVGIAIAMFFTQIFGSGIIVLTGIILIAMFLAMVGINVTEVFDWSSNKEKAGHIWITLLILAFIGFLVFLGAGGAAFLNLPQAALGLPGQDVWAIIFVLIVIALAMWFLMSQEDKPGGGAKPAGST
jgi:hypothetical protein